MTDLFSPLAQDRWFGVSLLLDRMTSGLNFFFTYASLRLQRILAEEWQTFFRLWLKTVGSALVILFRHKDRRTRVESWNLKKPYSIINLMTYDFLLCTNLISKVNDFVLDMQEICKKRDANVVFCISFCSFCKRSSLSLEWNHIPVV